MSQDVTKEQFEQAISHYYEVLKKEAKKTIAESADKEYAIEYCKTVLFEANDLIPRQSLMFDLLLSSYVHYSKLYPVDSFERTIAEIHQIRIHTQQELEKLQAFQQGKPQHRICDWYMEKLAEDPDMTIENLIALEKQVLDGTNENLTAALALHIAGDQLMEEYSSQPKIGERTQKKYEHQFTRKEQVLALYFLLESFDIRTYHLCHRTKLAALFHLIMGYPYGDVKKINNSAVYEILEQISNPKQNPYNNDKQYLKCLDKLKTYYTNANLSRVVETIEGEIQHIKSKA